MGSNIASALILAATVGYPARFMLTSDNLSAGVNKFEERLAAVTPWQVMVGYHQYRLQLGNMQELLTANAQLPPLQNLTDAHAGQPSTLVLVIGESTNRQRMSLYGYPRATTPKLDAIRDQLQVFDNVVTPRPYTIEALQQVLTFADEQNPDVMRQAIQSGVSAYIVEGIQAQRLKPILDVAMVRFESDQALRAQLHARDQQMAERKRVELAKGMLMKMKNCNEEEAYTLMRRQAMSRQQKLIQVAEQIIAMSDLLGS